ncbi:MAG: hypothetical protein AB7T63_02585 [Planctomycetota bacterium]
MARGRHLVLIASLALAALLLAGCGTESWTWTWASGDGNTTVHGAFDGTAKPTTAYDYPAYHYPMAPPETAGAW